VANDEAVTILFSTARKAYTELGWVVVLSGFFRISGAGDGMGRTPLLLVRYVKCIRCVARCSENLSILLVYT
jgi:hypothetical protein